MSEQVTVGIVDYGCGNIKSVANALGAIGAEGRLISSAGEFGQYGKLLLPGVGSFDHAMDNLGARGFLEELKTWVGDRDNKLLGICLGMQLLCHQSDESMTSTAGLGFIDADVCCLGSRVGGSAKVPHMGWNSIELSGICSESPLLAGLLNQTDFYFLHSYGVYAHTPDNVLASTQYGDACFASVVSNGMNVFGTQFHPEKSQGAGLQLLKNFIENA